MFQGLRTNSLFYVLDKGENPNLRIGQVVSVSNPQTRYPSFNNGFTKNDVAEKHIDNVFWVTNITNYSEKAATEKVKEKSECYGIKTSDKFKRFKIGTPSKFYITGTYKAGALFQ